MPCDENTNNSASDYIDVLNEVSALFNTYDGFKIILGGDFNVDFVRNSFNTKLLIDFMDSESLININSVFKNNEYTFESYNGSRSLVDYFMITENGKNNLLSYEVLDDGLNMSDHRPIVIKLNFSHSNAVEKFETVDMNFCYDWENATVDDIKSYKNCLDELLSFVYISDDIALCNDFRCSHHTDNEAVTYLEIIVDIMLLAAKIALPVKNVLI